MEDKVPEINPSVCFVTYRCAHHSGHSGYDMVSTYGGQVIRAKPLSASVIRNRLMWRLAGGIVSYDRESLATELKTARHMLSHNGCLYHILYGEDTYHYLGVLNRHRGHRIAATFHLPPDRFRQDVRIDWHVRQLSAAICVGSTQVGFFEGILGRERVHLVPLGVDTEFFTPPEAPGARRPDLCLFVGNHLRDFPTLRGAIELVAFQRPKVQFVVVTLPENYARIGRHPNLALHSGIPELELRELYRSATLLVMPMLDATANLAILEGMSCGLPVVTSDVGSVRDYVTEGCGLLLPPQDSKSMADAMLVLLDDARLREEMSGKARQQAMQFSWPTVVAQLQSVYRGIA